MKVLLVFPPISLKERYKQKVGDEIGGFLPPLGLCAMAAVLLEEGHEVEIMDCPVNNYIQSDVVKKVRQFKPDMVGIAAVTSLYDKTMAISKTIKEKFPSILVLIGGPHTKLNPEKILKETKANVVLVGDADITVIDIAKNKEKYMEPQIVQGEMVKDIDTLPYPARHLVDMSLYTSLPNNWKRSPNVFQVMCTRGCPFRCTFCASANSGNRRRSVKHVIGELKQLKKEYNIQEIAFWDDIFTVDRNWVMEFCQALKDENIDIAWTCETRLNLLESEMLKAMKETGCWNIFFGIEAGDQELLDNIKKGTNLDLIRKGIQMVKDAGIEIRGSFMLGLPGETPEKAQKTIDFAIELDCDYTQFSLCTPFPGTELYGTFDKWGKFVDRSNKNQTIWEPVFIPKGYSGPNELRKMLKKAYRSFYFRPSYVIKRISKVRNLADVKRNFLGLKMILGFTQH